MCRGSAWWWQVAWSILSTQKISGGSACDSLCTPKAILTATHKSRSNARNVEGSAPARVAAVVSGSGLPVSLHPTQRGSILLGHAGRDTAGQTER